MPRRKFPCAACGKLLQPGPNSLPEGQARHASCMGRNRRAPNGTRIHGTTTMYDRGKCRCDKCRGAKTEAVRKWRERRKAEGRAIDFSAYRPRVAAVCAECGVSFLARVDKRAQRFCSLDCANDAQGRAEFPRSRFKVARSVRLSIFEAAGWKCELCGSLTRPDEDYNHPRYPTLDHVVPRSRGGSDDVSNLRLACRQCNVLRGSNEDWVPGVTDESVGRLAEVV